MSAADDLALIAQLRLHAPHSEDGYMLLRAANAIEDANARVALAHADALNAAADAFGKDAWQDALHDAVDDVTATQCITAWLYCRAKAIEVGTI